MYVTAKDWDLAMRQIACAQYRTEARREGEGLFEHCGYCRDCAMSNVEEIDKAAKIVGTLIDWGRVTLREAVGW